MTAFFTIEKGVPMPPLSPEYMRQGGRPSKHPWPRMEPGDSIAVKTIHQAKLALRWANRNGRRFTYKQRTYKGQLFYRVWCVS